METGQIVIVPVATEEICTIHEYDKMDVPDLIPSGHGTENESNSDDDDDIGQDNNPQILHTLVHRHSIYVSDDEDSDDGALQELVIQEDCEANDADVKQNEVNVQPRYEITVKQKFLKAMKQLEASFNPDASRIQKVEMNCCPWQSQAQLH